MITPRVLVLVDLIQDIDVLAPVLARLKDEVRLRVVVSRWLRKESPRVETRLRAMGIAPSFVRRADVIAGTKPGLSGVDALLTASESTHLAHAAGFALAHRANTAGIATYTLQHGVENAGIAGAEAGERFASNVVFCWFPPESAPSDLTPETRAKLAYVGRPVLTSPSQEAPRYDLAVFENLHADRYSSEDRERFLRGLSAVAGAGKSVIVRPHPAGVWSTSLREVFAKAPNVHILTQEELRTQPGGAAETIASARRVITTPSTIALDAVQAGRPVALALPGGPVFEGLPVLHDEASWLKFADQSPDAFESGAAFLARTVLPGDAASRIIHRIVLDFQEKA